jgi:hypothetical protein
MKSIVIDLPSDIQKLKIVPFGDWHKDDPKCNKKFIEDTVNKIKNEPNTYAIANGDLLNFALAGSKSDIYSSKFNPQEQLEWAVETLMPIRDKILALGPGNHEDRAYKLCGIVPCRYITSQLGILDRYHDTGAIIFVSFGRMNRRKSEGRKITYSLYCKHGASGGKTAGAKVNALEAFADNIDADIYIGSHTHMPFQFPNGYYRVNLANRSIHFVTKLFVNTSAALDFGGYGEQYGYRPAALAHIEIELDGAKRQMTASLQV